MHTTTTRTLVALTVATTLALGLSGCRVAYDEPTIASQTAPGAKQSSDLVVSGHTSVTFEQLAAEGDLLDVRFVDDIAALQIVSDGGEIIVEDSDGVTTQQTDLGVEITLDDPAEGGYVALYDPESGTWLELDITTERY